MNGADGQSEDMLVAVLARVAMLEASLQALTGLLFTHMLSPSPGESSGWSPEAVADVVGECYGLAAKIKLEYFREQFPARAKILSEHASLPDIDLRDCFRKLVVRSAGSSVITPNAFRDFAAGVVRDYQALVVGLRHNEISAATGRARRAGELDAKMRAFAEVYELFSEALMWQRKANDLISKTTVARTAQKQNGTS